MNTGARESIRIKRAIMDTTENLLCVDWVDCPAPEVRSSRLVNYLVSQAPADKAGLGNCVICQEALLNTFENVRGPQEPTPVDASTLERPQLLEDVVVTECLHLFHLHCFEEMAAKHTKRVIKSCFTQATVSVLNPTLTPRCPTCSQSVCFVHPVVADTRLLITAHRALIARHKECERFQMALKRKADECAELRRRISELEDVAHDQGNSSDEGESDGGKAADADGPQSAQAPPFPGVLGTRGPTTPTQTAAGPKRARMNPVPPGAPRRYSRNIARTDHVVTEDEEVAAFNNVTNNRYYRARQMRERFATTPTLPIFRDVPERESDDAMEMEEVSDSVHDNTHDGMAVEISDDESDDEDNMSVPGFVNDVEEMVV